MELEGFPKPTSPILFLPSGAETKNTSLQAEIRMLLVKYGY